jgi:hypothetical protein
MLGNDKKAEQSLPEKNSSGKSFSIRLSTSKLSLVVIEIDVYNHVDENSFACAALINVCCLSVYFQV